MKYLIILSLILINLTGEVLKLSSKQIQSWNFQTIKPTPTNQIPLGEFLVTVTSPPNLQQAISLPFDVQVISIKVALYQKIKKGELLATVISPKWLQIQQTAISNAIEYQNHKTTYLRKQKLCKENIIAKKECIKAKAELNTDIIKLNSSKALLQTFTSDEKIINNIINKLKIYKSLPIISPVQGSLISMNLKIGKSLTALDSLFVIQKDGALWLEFDIPSSRLSSFLKTNKILIMLDKKTYEAKLLHISPVINYKSQTRHVRVKLQKAYKNLLVGYRDVAKIFLKQQALKIPKKSLIMIENKPTIFIKESQNFIPKVVKILSENNDFYYIDNSSNSLKNKQIVASSIIILKNMLGEDDE